MSNESKSINQGTCAACGGAWTADHGDHHWACVAELRTRIDRVELERIWRDKAERATALLHEKNVEISILRDSLAKASLCMKPAVCHGDGSCIDAGVQQPVTGPLCCSCCNRPLSTLRVANIRDHGIIASLKRERDAAIETARKTDALAMSYREVNTALGEAIKTLDLRTSQAESAVDGLRKELADSTNDLNEIITERTALFSNMRAISKIAECTNV